jgi:hypothetical protein
MKVRRLVETVIGQLSEQFHIEKVRARDLWHLTSRSARKILSHTVGRTSDSLGKNGHPFSPLMRAASGWQLFETNVNGFAPLILQAHGAKPLDDLA